MPVMLDVAKKYRAAGFSVIPLNGKVPMIDWKEYQTRFATDEELEKWFTGNENIGIVTGEISGITVVDIDAKSGGLETLKELHLPITWAVKTGGGGWHYYYKYDKRAGQTAGIYRGVDIRNDGGQVVAPPSLHKSGLRYEWSYKEDEMADFPIELFQQKQIIKKDWSSIIENGTGQGNRNDLAASLCGKLFNLFKPDEWERVVYPLVQSWNIKNTPPLPEKELRNVFESIAKRAVNSRPQTLYEVVSNNFTPRELLEKIKLKEREPKKFFTWGNADFDEEFPLLEYGIFAVLFGQFTSGKTTFAMFMAKMNALAGHKVMFLTLEVSKEKLIKQYIFKRAGVSKKKYKQGDYTEDIFDKYINDIETLNLYGVGEDPNSKTTYNLDDIEELIKTKSPDILFIDNFNKLKGEGTNDVNIDNNIAQRLLFMTRKYRVAIVVIHHTSKPSKERKKNILKGIGAMRGSNKIIDDADVVVELGRPTEEQLLDNPPNLSMIGIYKDRDFDSRGTHRLSFNDGIFNFEIGEIAKAFGGYVLPNF